LVTDGLPRLIRFLVRLRKQQPTTKMLSSTNEVPDATLMSNRKPDGAPVAGEVVVGGRPPSDDAGWDGGGASGGCALTVRSNLFSFQDKFKFFFVLPMRHVHSSVV
jgi:hypothetical protein